MHKKNEKRGIINNLKLGSESVLLNLLQETKSLMPRSKFVLSIQPSKGFVDYYKNNENSEYMQIYRRFKLSAESMGFHFFEIFKDIKKENFKWDRRHFKRTYHHKIALGFQDYIKRQSTK